MRSITLLFAGIATMVAGNHLGRTPGFVLGPSAADDPECGKCQAIADVVLMLDKSGSINDAEWTQLKTSGAKLINDFELGPDLARFGISTFAEQAQTILSVGSPKADKSLIVRGVVKTLAKGAKGLLTNFHAALTNFKDFQMPAMRGGGIAQVLILFTDGRPTTGPKIPAIVELSEEIRAAGAIIVAVGIGANVNGTFLTQISDLYIPVTGFSFDLLNDEYFKEGCGFTTCAPTSSPVTPTPRTTEAPTLQPTVEPTSMPTMQPTAQPIDCEPPHNVILVFDASSSETEEFFEKQREAGLKLLQSMEIAPGKNNVAMIFITDSAKVAVDFNDAYTGDFTLLFKRLKNIEYFGGWTDLPGTASRVRHVIKSMPANRKQLQTTVIVMSDGFPQLAEYASPKLRKKVLNGYKELKQNYAISVQCFSVGAKYSKNPANINLMTVLSFPNPVVPLLSVPPYPASINAFLGPICSL